MVMEGMLDEREVEDEGSKVRIHQWRQRQSSKVRSVR